jgi:hypothetical protein
MKSDITDRSLLREYLLGRLDEHAQIEEGISEKVLFSDNMTEIVDSVEDEILEEYLDGSLDSADKRAVETHFLQAPQRKEELRFAQLLRHHFETKSGRFSDKSGEDSVRPRVLWPAYLRKHIQFAALLFITAASLFYVTSIRRSRAVIESELARERERSATQLETVGQLPSAMVSLTLVAGRSRGTGARIPQVEINSSTRRIIVDVALQGRVSGPYDVRLERSSGEGPFWSSRLLPLMSGRGDARLLFDLPAQDLKSGIYSVVVSPAALATGTQRRFDFQTKVVQ